MVSPLSAGAAGVVAAGAGVDAAGAGVVAAGASVLEPPQPATKARTITTESTIPKNFFMVFLLKSLILRYHTIAVPNRNDVYFCRNISEMLQKYFNAIILPSD
jgi:hypothetical protein